MFCQDLKLRSALTSQSSGQPKACFAAFSPPLTSTLGAMSDTQRNPRARLRRFASASVAQAFEAFPPEVRHELLAVRELIFKTAASTPGVGKLEEVLKWGEPAYVASQSKSGSTVRLGSKKPASGKYAVYFNCQTNLVATFRTLFPHDFEYEGNRALVLGAGQAVPKDALAFCLAAALTHHLNKKSRASELVRPRAGT